MKAVIFAGGVGTRLWPLSRKKSPKQFERVVGNSTMLQLAVERLLPKFEPKEIFIATGAQYKEMVIKQLPDIPADNIITEPATRDVGPAVGLVTSIFMKIAPDEPFVILWGSDHLVKEKELFSKVLQIASQVVNKDKNKMVFVSQKPRFASQNLGWIEYGQNLEQVDGINFHEFKAFKYRPDGETAERYFADGLHAWNLGYFVTTPSFLWNLFEQFVPDMYKNLHEIHVAYGTDRYQEVLNRIYPTLEKISFDNAILEKLDPKSAYVISENLGWSDVGAWEALKEALEENREDNITKGKVMLEGSTDNLVYNFDDKLLIVGVDLENLLVVKTDDVLLVANKSSVPKIKKLVESFQGTENESLT